MRIFHSLRFWASVFVAVFGGIATAAEPSPGKSEGGVSSEAPAGAVSGDRQRQILQWIDQLGHPDYFTRERAQAELAKAGFDAFDALTAATAHADLEIAARARYLLGRIRIDWSRADDPSQVRDLLANYEFLPLAERLERMEQLADLPNRAGLPVLCRLVRFESSPLMSKFAAVSIVSAGPADEALDEPTAKLLRESLAGSQQPAAQWLIAYAAFRDDPASALATWAQLIRDEQEVLSNSPGRSSPEVLSSLIRFQINWLGKLNRRDETVAAMKQLIVLENGDPETLLELIDWLVEQKAWEPIQELADRFAVRIGSNPILLYALAGAYQQRGDAKRSEEYALQAAALYPGKQPEDLLRHLLIGYTLKERGLFPWAEREFLFTADNSDVADEYAIRARTALAEMHHDLGNDLQAAESLQKLIDAFQPDQSDDTILLNSSLGDETLGEVRARYHYFHACHHQAKGDAARHRESLEKALEAFPAEIDVLIACWQLPDAPADFRERISGLIDKCAATIREQIADDPAEAISYNQLAWLLGNSKGDYDEAVKLSHRSLELDPENGGYYDTLAHCYYAKKDYANAVAYQRKAVKREPHSAMIARKLAVFEKALAEHPEQQPKTP